MNDKHICPKCRGKQIYIGNTWICTICDREAYEDIKWCEKWKENVQNVGKRER